MNAAWAWLGSLLLPACTCDAPLRHYADQNALQCQHKACNPHLESHSGELVEFSAMEAGNEQVHSIAWRMRGRKGNLRFGEALNLAFLAEGDAVWSLRYAFADTVIYCAALSRSARGSLLSGFARLADASRLLCR